MKGKGGYIRGGYIKAAVTGPLANINFVTAARTAVAEPSNLF